MNSRNVGYIKAHRSLIDWEWYKDIKVTRVFIHLLLTANYKDKNWHGKKIKRGQIVTSKSELAKATNLSQQEIKTALRKLQSTNELTSESTNNYTILEIVNYDVYQSLEEDSNQRSNQLATNDSTNGATNNPTNGATNKKTTAKPLKYSDFEDLKKKSNQRSNQPRERRATNGATTTKEYKKYKNIRSVCNDDTLIALEKRRMEKRFQEMDQRALEKRNSLDEDFEKLWFAYEPVRTKKGGNGRGTNKAMARINYAVCRMNHPADIIYDGAGRYLLDCHKSDRFSCSVENFLKNKVFLDHPEPTKKEVKNA